MAGNADLTLEAFTILREQFFDQNGVPKAFPLREKRNTQDNPTFIFANPLGIPELDNAVTLIHPDATLAESEAGLQMAYRLIRTAKDGEQVFYCYRLAADIGTGHPITDLKNPFPTPLSRSTRTQSRGRFRLPIEPLQDEVGQ